MRIVILYQGTIGEYTEIFLFKKSRILECLLLMVFSQLQLQTDFQFTTLNSCGSYNWVDFFAYKFDRVIFTPVGFCAISPWSFSGLLSNRKKALLRCLLNLHAKFHPIPSSGLPCRCDRPSTFFYTKNQL